MAKVTARQIIERAKSVNAIYVWGGSGPDSAGYDCSGFVGYCVSGSYSRIFNTDCAKYVLPDYGFKNVINSVNTYTGSGMKKGDILIWNPPGGTTGPSHSGHTEIYWGNGLTCGARSKGQPIGIHAPLISVNRGSAERQWQECWRPSGGDVFIYSVS